MVCVHICVVVFVLGVYRVCRCNSCCGGQVERRTHTRMEKEAQLSSSRSSCYNWQLPTRSLCVSHVCYSYKATH